MKEIIENILGMVAEFINKLFLFEVNFFEANYVPIGKIILAFLFIVLAIYFILDALGIVNNGGDD